MRKVKYRVWDKEFKVFDNCPSPDILLGDDGTIYEKQSYTFAMQTYDEYVETDRYEVTLSTGLYDKNGRAIYEGDIVHIKHFYKNREHTGTVVYDYNTFKVQNFYFPHFDNPKDAFECGADIIEVIGNIYENPELIRE